MTVGKEKLDKRERYRYELHPGDDQGAEEVCLAKAINSWQVSKAS